MPPTETIGVVIKGLAVIGGGVVGGLVVGWLIRVLVLLFAGQRLPRWLHWVFRALGALLVGWLVYLYVFGGGGSGFGGFGGTGTGGNNPPAEKDTVKDKPATDNKDGKDNSSTMIINESETLTVEVLSEPDLKRVHSKPLNPNNPAPTPYRILNGDGKLRSRPEIQEYIEKRQKRKPPLRKIILVLYKETPRELQEPVYSLKTWAEDRRVLYDGETRQIDGKDERVEVTLLKKPRESAPLN
jgi:hypothetical protein